MFAGSLSADGLLLFLSESLSNDLLRFRVFFTIASVILFVDTLFVNAINLI